MFVSSRNGVQRERDNAIVPEPTNKCALSKEDRPLRRLGILVAVLGRSLRPTRPLRRGAERHLLMVREHLQLRCRAAGLLCHLVVILDPFRGRRTLPSRPEMPLTITQSSSACDVPRSKRFIRGVFTSEVPHSRTGPLLARSFTWRR